MMGKVTLKRVCILIAGIILVLSSTCDSAVQQVGKKDLEYVLPTAADFVRKIEPVPHYAGYTSPNGSLVGVAFLTTEVAPDESWGYSAQIESLVGVDLQGRITAIKVLSEFESPRYVRGLLREGSWFLTQFETMSADDPFVLQYDVDAISGATITSSTVNRSIKTGLQCITLEVLTREVSTPGSEHTFWQYLFGQIDLILLWVITGTAFYAFFSRIELLRYFSLGMAFAYIGIFKGGGLSLVDILRVLSFRSPVFLSNLYWYSLLTIAVGVTLIAGRFYCGWLCPFGAFTELLHRVIPLGWTLPERVDRWLKLLKYINLVILLILGLILASPLFAIYLIGIVEPFGTFFHLDGDLIARIWLVLMLLSSSVISRFYCRYFCPLGAFFAVFAAISSFLGLRRLRVDLTGNGCQDSCQGCRVAQKQCQMNAIQYDVALKKADIDENECFMCNGCAAVCPLKSKRIKPHV